MDELVPGIKGYSYKDLYKPVKLKTLHELFLQKLAHHQPE